MRAHQQISALVVITVTTVLTIGAAVAADGSPERASAFATVLKWVPLLLSGFWLNILMSVLAMAIGTVIGVILGVTQLSKNRMLASFAVLYTHFFRNAPWLVVLFFVMFLLPFNMRLGSFAVGIPDWVKATFGLSLPVAANISEITRGAILSIPSGQWDAGRSLGLSRGMIFYLVIIPQCVRRMLPPWMNWYAILLMATVLSSIVGVTEILTLTERVTASESRPDILLPIYGFVMALFFVFCYPIARATYYLERRFGLTHREAIG
jgi:polar amino acid transport system permease protein